MFSYTDISLTEIPNCVSLVIYNPTCNMKCPWCFNMTTKVKKPLTFKQMKDAIDEHIEFIDGVVFSGGEPLTNPFLIKTINYAKEKGLKVKLNTNGLVYKGLSKNIFIPYIDYINVSLKGFDHHYTDFLKPKNVSSCLLRCDTLEYSFVYSAAMWPRVYIDVFHDFLKNKIRFDWMSLFANEWSRPEIFTITQMQTGECLNPQYNDCRVPTRDECISIARIFSDIPTRKLMVETKEYGRESINIIK